MSDSLTGFGTRQDPVASPLPGIQRSLWFADQLNEHRGGYLVPVLLRIGGPLDTAALCSALRRLVERHEVLRTSVVAGSEVPLGVLRPVADFEVTVEDMAHLAADPAALDAELRAEAGRPMDLAVDLPIRARLWRLGPADHVLCVVVHHIAFDDMSRTVLYREFAALYRGEPLEPLSVSFQEFAVRQETRLDAGDMAGQLDFWREKLAGSEAFELPPDLARPARRSGNGAVSGVRLPPATLDGLRRIGRERGASLAMVLFAACQVLFSRYSGRTDVTFGTSCAMRDDVDTENLIGPLTSMLVLRGDTSGRPTFAELVDRMAETALEAYEAKDVPFDRLVGELAPERDLSRTPLVQIVVDVGAGQQRELNLPGLTVAELPVVWSSSKYDMSFWCGQDETGLLVEIGWDTALYLPDTIERMAGHLRTLLEFVAAAPDVPIDEVPLLGPAERAELDSLTAPDTADVPGKCLHDLFDEQVTRTPGAVAVVDDEDGGHALTYMELKEKADRIAVALRALGVGPDQPVGILIDRSVDLVAVLLGVMKAGGAYLPLETDAPPARISQLLVDSGTRVCVVRPDLAPVAAAADCAAVTVEDLLNDVPDGLPSEVPAGPDPENLCAVYFTSGSTGRPKGVACAHAGWVNRMLWMQRRLDLRQGETVLQKTTLTFDDSAVEIFWPLLTGGRVAMLPPRLHGDPRAIIDAAIRHEVVHIQFVPSVLDLFLDTVTPADVARMPRLRSVLSGGEALPVDAVRRHFELFGDSVMLTNIWGPTEVSIDSSCHTCDETDAMSSSAGVSIGRPLTNTYVYVLDENLRPQPVGVPGELYIGGNVLARGYLNDPGRTAEVFVPHPERAGERMYRTGDIGRWRPDGLLHFLGRRDHQVKIRGVRIELGEVEAVLRAHPGVLDAAAVTWQTPLGDKRIAAYVVPGAEGAVAVPELRTFVTDRLPVYAVPSAIMILAVLPRLPNGKLDRRSLPQPDIAGAPEADYRPPATLAEETLTEIWAEVLGLSRLGTDDNFFAVGGHSLLVTRVVNRMREQFAADIPLSLVFEHPTVRKAADQVERILTAEIESMSEEDLLRLTGNL